MHSDMPNVFYKCQNSCQKGKLIISSDFLRKFFISTNSINKQNTFMPSSPSADNEKLCSVICIPPKAHNAAIAIEFKTKAAFKGS